MPSLTLHTLVHDPRLRETLATLPAPNRRGESAEEFLSSVPVIGQLGTAIAQKLGSQTGIANVTRASYTIPLPATPACLSVCAALFGRGIAITEIFEGDARPNYIVFGTAPSSSLHWEGTFEAAISQEHDGAETSLNVTYPGQLIAWGAGPRLLKHLKTDSLAVAVRIACALKAA